MNMAASKLLAAHLRRFADCSESCTPAHIQLSGGLAILREGKKAHKDVFIQMGLSKCTHIVVHTPVLSVNVTRHSKFYNAKRWVISNPFCLAVENADYENGYRFFLTVHPHCGMVQAESPHSGGKVYFSPGIWSSRITWFLNSNKRDTTRSLEMTWTLALALSLYLDTWNHYGNEPKLACPRRRGPVVENDTAPLTNLFSTYMNEPQRTWAKPGPQQTNHPAKSRPG